MKSIYEIRSKMKKIYNKMNILIRKEKAFGLTDEEKVKLNSLKEDSYILHEELIEVCLNKTVMPYLINNEYTKSLKEVKELIRWNGGLIRREEELNFILEDFLTLSIDEKDILVKNLKFMHELICKSFEDFCSTESGYEHIRLASKVISNEADGNILDVLVYLDARYRELAELFEVELQEIEILWSDEDE